MASSDFIVKNNLRFADELGNIKIGEDALSTSTAEMSVAIGTAAGSFSSASSSAMIGMGAGSGSSAISAVLIGEQAGANGSGQNNIVIGSSAGANSGGEFNVILGGMAGEATVGINNIAIGTSAGSNIANDENIAIGTSSYSFGGGDGGGIYIGQNAGIAAAPDLTVSPGQVIAIGNGAAQSTQRETIAIGFEALKDNVTGEGNIAIGNSAAGAVTGIQNTIIGNGTLGGITPGPAQSNVAIGHNVLAIGQIAASSVVVGANAMAASSLGAIDSVVVGASACNATTIANGSVMVGYQIGPTTTSSLTSCVGIGRNVLDATGNKSGATSIGANSGRSLTTGLNNTFIGFGTSGSTSTGVTSGSNNTLIGANATPLTQTQSNHITLGNSSIAALRCAVTTITSLSDERDKTNIQDSPYGLNFINELRPVTFEWDMRDEDGKHGDKDLGFIAQELIAVEDAFDAHDSLALTLRDNPDRLEASPSRLVPVLVKAIQELSTMVSELKEEIAILKA